MSMNQKIQSEQSQLAEQPSAESATNNHSNTISATEPVESHLATNEAPNATQESVAHVTLEETSIPTETATTELNEAVISAVEATPSVAELKRQLTEVTQKAETYWNNLLRKQAEYDNLQKRIIRDLDNARKYALEKFATELLAIKDSMELGLDALTKPETTLDTVREGVTLTAKMLTDVMARFNILEINPQNQKFDPQWHEAIAMQPLPDIAPGTVLHVHQKGYQLNDRLLRPARVIVAKGLETEKSLENQG